MEEDANQIFVGWDSEKGSIKGTVSLEEAFESDEVTYSSRLIFRDYPRPYCSFICFDGKRNHHPIYRNWHVPNW